MPPIRRFFVIKRMVEPPIFFDVSRGMWWHSIANATHFCAPTRALSYVDEFGLTDSMFAPPTVIQCIAEHTTPDHGEDWKK